MSQITFWVVRTPEALELYKRKPEQSSISGAWYGAGFCTTLPYSAFPEIGIDELRAVTLSI